MAITLNLLLHLVLFTTVSGVVYEHKFGDATMVLDFGDIFGPVAGQRDDHMSIEIFCKQPHGGYTHLRHSFDIHQQGCFECYRLAPESSEDFARYREDAYESCGAVLSESMFLSIFVFPDFMVTSTDFGNYLLIEKPSDEEPIEEPKK
ncbi:hypothetical protein FOZ60_001390 [Perkinsus olseni]|uniref:Uncharacterized protein n=1 Tax=Perkinsus olseni TaxID=32597 RepID=A0A7J6PKI2_PEROL|nr:hypothetical protein FOZ60_001390 [Perkinsus olseni]